MVDIAGYSSVAGPAKEEAKVNTPSAAYEAAAEKWCLLDDLCGGTFQMRAAEEKWLPKEDKETDVAYRARVNRSFLFPALSDTVDKLAGKPFSQPIVLEGEDKLDASLQELSEDVDRQGTSLTAFARDMFYTAIRYGLTHVLVDYPEIPNVEGATLAYEREVDARPFFVHVKPTQLIGSRFETQPNGKVKLTQVRIYECKTEPDGQFGDVEVEYIRVYNVTTWELWRKSDTQKEFALYKQGTHTFGGVPLVTYYVNRSGFMTALPPLWDLAELNLCHWQSYSDQRNILRFARVGLLFAKGFNDEDLDKGIYVGPNQMISTTSKDADLKYVEHSGASIGAGRDDLKDLEERMEVLGLQPLITRSASSTATGKIIDENRTASDIQTWIRDLEDAIIDCYQLAAQWLGTEVKDDALKVNLSNNFDLAMRNDTDIQSLTAIVSAGKISDKTFLNEIKRRGLLQDTLDIEKELSDIAAQGPSLSDLTGEIQATLGSKPGQETKPTQTKKLPAGA